MPSSVAPSKKLKGKTAPSTKDAKPPSRKESSRPAAASSHTGSGQASSSRCHDTLMHCAACRANSKDASFALKMELDSAEAMMCEMCYWVWYPIRHLYTWAEYCKMLVEDSKFKERAMAARSKQFRPDSSNMAKATHPESLVSSGEFAVKLSKSGRFLRRSDFKQLVGKKATPKQCRLKEPLELTMTHKGEKVSGYLLSDASSSIGWHCEIFTIAKVQVSKAFLPLGQSMIEGIGKQAMQTVIDSTDDGLQNKQLKEFFMGKSTSLQEVRDRAERHASSKDKSTAGKHAPASKRRKKGGDSSSSDGDGSQDLGEQDESEDEREEDIENSDAEEDDGFAQHSKDGAEEKEAEQSMQLTTPKAKQPRSSPKPKGSPSVLIEKLVEFKGPGDMVMRMMTPKAKESHLQEAAMSDDGKSMAGATSVGGGGERAVGKNKTPGYWIAKMPATVAMLQLIDNRNVIQANKCVDRESKAGHDNAEAKRLKKHLSLLAFCQSLLPDRINLLSNDELETALAKVSDAGLAVPPDTCWAILGRSMKKEVDSLMSGFSLAAATELLERLRPFARNAGEIFHYNRPVVAALLNHIPLDDIIKKWSQWMYHDTLIPLIEAVESEQHIQRCKIFCEQALQMLELPEDADPHEDIVELVAESLSTLQAVLMILEPRITMSTTLAVIDDIKAVSDAAEDTKSQHFMGAVGNAIKAKMQLAKNLADIMKWQSEWKAHGAAIQGHMYDMAEAIKPNDLVTKIAEAIETYEKYSVNLPAAASLELQKHISEKAKKCGTMAMETQTAEFNLLKEVSAMLVGATRVAPMDAELVQMQYSIADMLRKYSDQSKFEGLTEKAKAAVTKDFGDNSALVALDAFKAARDVKTEIAGDDDKHAFGEMVQKGIEKAALMVHSSFEAPDGLCEECNLIMELCSEGAKYCDANIAASVDSRMKLLVAYCQVSSNYRDVKKKYGEMEKAGRIELRLMEPAMRSLARVVSKAKTMAQAHSASAPDEMCAMPNFGICEEYFNDMSKRLIVNLKLSGKAPMEAARAEITRMTKPSDGVNWKEDSHKCKTFKEVVAIAEVTILTGDIEGFQLQMVDLVSLMERFSSLQSGLQMSGEAWDELKQLVWEMRVLVAECVLVKNLSDKRMTRGSLRGIAKSVQDDLVAHGIDATAFAPALMRATKAAGKMWALPP